MIYTNINEEGQIYAIGYKRSAAEALLKEFPNDIIVVSHEPLATGAFGFTYGEVLCGLPGLTETVTD